MKKSFFLTLEGPDGCGKTTQSLRLADFLERSGRSVVLTREPGGTAFAERLRALLLDPAHRISALTELMLFETIRAHHSEDLIRPSLAAGKTVLCDRYTDSTLAYQGYGRGMDLPMIRELNRIASAGLKPDLTLVLDLPAKEGLARVQKKKGAHSDRMEREALAFHERVRRGYLQLARKEPRRVKIVSALGTIEEVGERLVAEVRKRLKLA